MQEITRQVFVETEYDEVNVGAIITQTGVICIDVPSYARDARDWAARMHRLSPYPVQHVLLTDASGDRVLNTRWLNAPLTVHRFGADLLRSYDKKFPQAMIDSLSARNPHRGRELNGTQVESPITNFTSEIVMYKHGRAITLRHVGGPTLGNSWIILPKSDIIFAGDTLMLDTHPHLAAPTSRAWMASMATLRDKLPTHTIVPGRGKDVSADAINSSIRYLEKMQERVAILLNEQEPRESTAHYIDEFIGLYPLNSHPVHWVQQYIRASLGHIYDELKAERVVEEIY